MNIGSLGCRKRIASVHPPPRRREKASRLSGRSKAFPSKDVVGYPGFAVLAPLQRTEWAQLFRSMVTRSSTRFETHDGYSVGIVMTTRPFPFTRAWLPEELGLPVLFDGAPTEADIANLHWGEMALDPSGQPVTAGFHGWTMVVTGVGDTVTEAQKASVSLADRVVIPDARYRRDIGDKLIGGDLDTLRSLGLYDGH